MQKKSILASTLLAAFWGYAQEKPNLTDDKSAPISEIVIYETRLQLPSSTKNRNLQILDKAQIKQLPVRSVNELLAYVSGVDIRQRGPFGTQADLSIDGGSFEQNLVLLNGQKISDPQTGHNSLNIPVPIEAIERIEVVRGPSARLYGVNSLTGVVNIVTKNPHKDGLFAHIYGGSSFEKDSETGHDEWFNGRGVQLGGSWVEKKHNHLFFGSQESGNGYRYNTDFHNSKLFYQGNIQANDRNNLMVLGGLVRSSFGANGFYAAPIDKEAKEIINTYLLSLSSKHLLSEAFTVAPSIAYRYNYDDYRFYRNDLSKARSQHYSNALTTDVKAHYRTDYGVLSTGVEWRYEEINSSNIGAHNRSNYGLFAEFKREFFNRLDVNAGAYANYNSFYGWQVFPGVDASYRMSDQWQALFSVGSSQRIPSFTDLYLNQKPNLGNPHLKPESAYQIEGGVRFKTDHFSANAFVFYRDIDQFIDWVRSDETQPWQTDNAASNRTIGMNTAAKYRWNLPRGVWDFGLAYTYLSPEIDDPAGLSKYTVESFKHQVVTTVNYRHKKWSAMWTNRYNERLSYKSYFLTDARLGYELSKYSFYLDAQNIFNHTYVEAGAVPMPGRWFTVGVKFNAM
ncbi:TonB-dependent receptor plug domain-containing protein [Flavobacterium sp. JP2137]|uniref:TonB-dependent receptor plug domain-containing protein n=1 Tax=Flavobacterium sp. JP2137 TaxID=3414510 RepID=UPI003D2FEC83